jgi:hypothetical protein
MAVVGELHVMAAISWEYISERSLFHSDQILVDLFKSKYKEKTIGLELYDKM